MTEDVKTDNVTLLLGDCLERMNDIANGAIDLTVTSPPYDNLRTYNNTSVFWNETIWKRVLETLYSKTKDGGVLVWVVGDATISGSETGTSFKQALYAKEIGFNIHDTMIYEKDSMSFPNPTRYHQIFEYMFVFSKGKPKTVNLIADRKNLNANGRKHIKGNYRTADGEIKRHNKQNLLKEYGVRNNIWRISTGHNKSTTDKIAFQHPAIFPESLARDQIISWSNPSDLVMDPFLGSGTTGKMALSLGRKFVGIEIDEAYFEIAKARILQSNSSTLSGFLGEDE